ncbi:MAG: DUF4249 domain-containing protein [Candidatus Symbiothrix sp.]|jgi:hypothetical protein|nr:DUF4249 domain-containing protein [Candidatus Symbiothrix sp.]
MLVKKYAYLFLMLGFTSCHFLETEIDIGDYPVEPRIVVNAVIYAGCDSNLVFLNDSYSLFDRNASSQNRTYLKDAQSILSKNGVPNSEMYFRSEDNVLYFNEKFDAGDKAEIEVTDKGRKVSASVIIPEKPVILAVDTVHFSESTEYGSTTYGWYYSNYYYLSPKDRIRLLIKIKAQAGKKNYYRIHAFNELTIYYRELEPYTFYYQSFQSDDPILNKTIYEFDKSLDITSLEYNEANIFSDELFQNGEYILNLYTEDWSEIDKTYSPFYNIPQGDVLSRKYQLRINLQSISEDLYFYYSSLQRYQQLNETLIEPIRVHNNINGGLGIFGAVNELEYVVLEKEMKNP